MSKKSVSTTPDSDNQPSLFSDAELTEFTLSNGIRGVFKDGEKYISILDAYKAEGSVNNARDWTKDLAELRQQGYNTNVTSYQFFNDSGKKSRPTPIVTAEQLIRIAQVAKFPNWEHIRQEIVNLYVDKHKQKTQIPVEQTKEYRRHLESGYSSDQAKRSIQVREQLKIDQDLTSKEWKERGAVDKDYPLLNNDVTEAATGKTASEWKIEMGIKDSPRNHFSSLKNGLIDVVLQFSRYFHQDNDSHGVRELESDIFDAGEIIDKDKLKKVLSDRSLKIPPPKPKQLELPSGDNE